MAPPVFWRGRLTTPMTLLVNMSNAIAWANGSARDVGAMKQRVARAYDGEFSDHVARYDELGLELQRRSARLQLDSVDLEGMDVLDVGSGTGILSFLALEKGAASVTCGDISPRMLEAARENARARGYGDDRITFTELDAEELPFPKDRFDVAMTGMTFGLLPRQQQAVKELARVTRPGGLVCVGAHGPEHYWEAIDASFRAISKRQVLGYRIEFWPRTDAEIEAMLVRAGLVQATTLRALWRNDFPAGGDTYDFFTAVTAAWWYAAFPPERVAGEAAKERAYFERHRITRLTDDVVFGYARKAGAAHQATPLT